MGNAKAELLEFIKAQKNISLDFVEKARDFQGDIYLFGAGSHLPFAVGFMQKYGLRVKGILDSSKSGKYQRSSYKSFYDGDIPIIKFDEFLSGEDAKKNCWFVISAPSAEEAIRKTIVRYFPEETIFSFETELYVDYFSLLDVEAYRAYLLDHWDGFLELYDALADGKSRDTLTSVLKGRLSGELSYFRQCCVSDQYYPSDIIRFSKDEVTVDLGAYEGETLLELIPRCPDYQAAYCFEPDVNLLPQLEKVKEQQAERKKRVYVVPKGAWDCSTTLKFSTAGTLEGSSHIMDDCEGERSYAIETAAVDEVVKEPISYMKMDIEGSELRALHGAETQIRTNRPKLAVCVYHKNEDILDIWNYLRSLTPEYQFYLRHHTTAGTETVLYAVPIVRRPVDVWSVRRF